MLVIKPVTEHSFDVFWGIGWNNWCRFQRDKGLLHKVGGTYLPKEVMSQLRSKLNAKR